MQEFMKELISDLNANDSIMFLIDKTNRYVSMKVENYKSKIIKNLSKTAVKIKANKIQDKRKLLIKHLNNLELIISKNKFLAAKHQIESYTIPMPRLLVKDHKKPNDDGIHPSRLVIPAESFISGFSELGYLTIKETFKKNQIKVGKFTIAQASSLKRDLEELSIDKKMNSIASIDIVNFYLSVSYSMIEKAVQFFGKDLDENERRKLEIGLEMLKLGMSTQIV